MKNIRNILLLSLSLMSTLPMVAQQPIASGVSQPSKLAAIPYWGGWLCTLPFKAVFYGSKYALQGIGSGFTWGIDGACGYGTAASIGSVTKTTIGLGIAGTALYSGYRVLNGFMRWLNISDIQDAFEKNGSANQLNKQTIMQLRFNNCDYKDIREFNRALKKELQRRIERFEVMQLWNTLSGAFRYTKAHVNSSCQKIDKLIGENIKSVNDINDNTVQATITNVLGLAEQYIVNRLTRNYMLNRYYVEALSLYTELSIRDYFFRNNISMEPVESTVVDVKQKDFAIICEALNKRMGKGK